MAILIDTSVWIEHFRTPVVLLVEALERGDILIHSAILGEIAAGSLKNRSAVLGDLKQIPKIQEVPSIEVMEFIENKKLFGKGLSWTDLHLLASCLTSNCDLLSYDKKMMSTWEELKE